MKYILTLSLAFIFHFNSTAGIFCPADITIGCDDDYHNLDLTGEPTLVGNHSWYFPKYIDTLYLNACNIGFIQRLWFGDQNGNNLVDLGEPFCTQIITLDGNIDNVNIVFPADKVLSCKDDITDEGPYWTSAPCDLVGYTYDEEVITFAADACYKIIRHFEVINWCTYDPNNGNNEGIWYHTQVIKVIDTQSPEINHCEDLTFDIGENCSGTVTLTNSAADLGDCPSPLLRWTVNIDLWADGTVDYTYGAFEQGDFYIAPTANDEEIAITIPELVVKGNHKLVWKVTDACGNVKSCNTKFYTQDNKAPTPYCHTILTTTVNGPEDILYINARDFNVGGFDNCTAQEDLKFTFSAIEGDSIREITCANDGFRFFRIYITDDEGNSDFCEVYLIAFDNSSCNNKIALEGRIINQNGTPVNGVEVNGILYDDIMNSSMTNENGDFTLQELPLLQDYKFIANVEQELAVDLADLVLLQKYFLGLASFNNIQKIAADVTGDNKIKVNDIQALADYLLGRESSFEGGTNPKIIPSTFIYDSPNNMYRNLINFGEIPGRLDFVAINPGNVDFSPSENLVDNKVQLEWITNEDGSHALTALNDADMDGIYFELNYNNFDFSIDNINPILKNNYQNNFDKSFKSIKTNTSSLKAGDKLLTIDAANKIDDITLSAYSLDNKNNKIDWEIINTNTKNEILFTTVSNGYYQIPTNIEIVNIYNTKGQHQAFQYTDGMLNIENAVPGLYIVMLKNEAGISETKKIIKF